MIPVDDAWYNFNKQGHTNIPRAIEKKNVNFPLNVVIYIYLQKRKLPI